MHRDPDPRGYFGEFGGRYVPETLVEPVEELERAYRLVRDDAGFRAELERLLKHYVGRPTPIYEARRLTAAYGGARIFLKREDLTHTGAHKINNALGQALLAVRMGKRRIVAETGAGQHGVATATVCALLGLECHVYMGTEDMARQSLNVFRMRLLGAEVCPVASGSRTLKDAINEAMRDWVTNVGDTYYLLGSVLGPHPYPLMVREFQSVIGREARAQILELAGCLPAAIVACVGGGSNAIGIFDAFVDDPDVQLIGVEAGGEEIVRGRHAARFAGGSAGVLQGTRTFILQDDDGNIDPTHSISAGLDYAAVGPEHAWLRSLGRTAYAHVTDAEALEAFQTLAKLEGILPALESAHAVAYAQKVAPELGRVGRVALNLSGRGDKDVNTVETMPSRIDRHVRATAARAAAGPRDLHDSGRPGLPRSAGDPAGARPRGRGRSRGGRAVFRSAGRRPGHPAGNRARPGGWRQPAGLAGTRRRTCGRMWPRPSSCSATPIRCCAWALTAFAAAAARPGSTECWRSTCRSRRRENSAKHSRRQVLIRSSS